MTDALFEFDLPKGQTPFGPLPITDAQIAEIRQAFAAAAITEQGGRKAIIDSCVLRPVQSLRDLYSTDFRRVIDRIQNANASQPEAAEGSAWDNREEDTWIDRL
ncbi:hypothetical protein [Arthrobacter sp. GMC3]|uniref:hypothetical protein n=1 Tax=Arthrobacter sp. GMC3 TaxID=2058894 RepID=UPI000CE31CCD|nr:hypothetical protein [Arthrobacter sp. GMC3]